MITILALLLLTSLISAVPTITIDSPQNTSYSTDTIDLNWSADEVLDWASYSLDGGANDSSIFVTANTTFQETQDAYTDVGTGTFGGVLINYTIPDGFDEATWRVAYRYPYRNGSDCYSNTTEINLTIPSICFGADEDVLKLRVKSVFEGYINDVFEADCWNGTGYQNLLSQSGNVGGSFGSGYSSNSLSVAFNGNYADTYPASYCGGACGSGGAWFKVQTTCDGLDSDYNGFLEESITWDRNKKGINTTLTSLSDGSHFLELFANNSIGELGTSSVYFLTDTTAPTITITSPQAISYDFPLIPLDVSADEEITSWYYSFDGGATNTTLNISNLPIFELETGVYTLDVYAEDLVGNIGNSEVVFAYNTIIPDEIIFTGEDSSNLYGLMRSLGAGMGLLFVYLTSSLPILILGLMIIGVIVAIGFAIVSIFNKFKLREE